MALVDSIISATVAAYLARVETLYGASSDSDPDFLRVNFVGQVEGAPPPETYQLYNPGVFIEYLFGDALAGEVGGITVGEGRERFNVYGIVRFQREMLGLELDAELDDFQALAIKWSDKFMRRMIYAGDKLKPSAVDEFGWKTGMLRPVVWGMVGVGAGQNLLDYLCYVQFLMNVEQ